jgi:glycerophosphoryl diester phosphodiesterase
VDGTEPIPRLDELLGTWPELRVNIDPKHDGAVDALAQAIERLRN